jgi:non-specific protein-tyrosine kinase
MTLRQHLRELGSRWPWIVGGLVLGLLVAWLMTARSPERYEATTTAYLSPGQSNNDPIAAYQGALFTDQRMKSYAQLVSGERVAQDVIADLGLDESVDEVAAKLSATAQPDTVVLRLTATDSTPHGAAALANAAASSLARLVPLLERPPGEIGPYPVTVQIVAQAAPSANPVAPDPARNLVLGALAGLLAGLGGAALRRATDDSVRSVTALADAVPVPVLGVLPLPRGRERARAAATLALQEAYRRVRTNLHHTGLERGVVAVTSASRGEGRTSFVMGLAGVLAAAGSRVLTVDADFRKPRLGDHPDQGGATGLTDVLAGLVPLDTAIRRAADGSFDVLAAGAPPVNPSELASSQQLADVLEELSGRYELLIVDSPPLLDVTDGAELAAFADCAVLVCRFRRTTRGELLAATDTLSTVSARLVGTVLTMAPDQGGVRADTAVATDVGDQETAAKLALPGALVPRRLRRTEARGIGGRHDGERALGPIAKGTVTYAGLPATRVEAPPNHHAGIHPE